MSDLKHKTPQELAKEIASISAWRRQKEYEASQHEQRAAVLREQANDEDLMANELRKRAHNMGQREAAARMYLAQKT